MKKYIVSGLTIGLFVFYILFLNTPTSKPITASNSSLALQQNIKTIAKSLSGYKNGTFTGSTFDAYYGNVQVVATISKGRLSNISFLDYPQDRSASLQRSNYAIPILKSEAISSQSANVDSVSGVTYTSEAFMSSLSTALAKAIV